MGPVIIGTCKKGTGRPASTLPLIFDIRSVMRKIDPVDRHIRLIRLSSRSIQAAGYIRFLKKTTRCARRDGVLRFMNKN